MENQFELIESAGVVDEAPAGGPSTDVVFHAETRKITEKVSRQLLVLTVCVVCDLLVKRSFWREM